MAVVLSDCDVVLLSESTMICDLKEFGTGKLVKGERLVVLSEAVQKDHGEIAIRHLMVDRTPKCSITCEVSGLGPKPSLSERGLGS